MGGDLTFLIVASLFAVFSHMRGTSLSLTIADAIPVLECTVLL
jgi:hypothetical protein